MYSTSGTVQQSGTITIPNSRRFTVTGLHAGTVYELSVLASTRVGPGPIAGTVARTDQLSECITLKLLLAQQANVQKCINE